MIFFDALQNYWSEAWFAKFSRHIINGGVIWQGQEKSCIKSSKVMMPFAFFFSESVWLSIFTSDRKKFIVVHE